VLAKEIVFVIAGQFSRGKEGNKSTLTKQ